MATTLMPLDPATSPQRAVRVLAIAARLLPEEITAARRARKVRGRVIAILVLVVLLLGAWYGYAWQQAHSAQAELNAVTRQAQAVQQHQSQFSDVVNTQNETATISRQLATLLATDLRWAKLISTIRDAGSKAGVTVTGVNGSLAKTGAGAGNVSSLPRRGGGGTLGTINVTGTAPDKSTLAKYVDALSNLKVVANPYLTSAAESDSKVQFNLLVDITSDALGGRFTKSTSTGGK